MRRWGISAFGAVVAGGFAAVAIAAGSDERDLAFTLGVRPSLVAAEIPPGAEGCQRPVPVSEPFTGVRTQLGTYERPGPPLELTVRDARGSAVLARGDLARGYPDVSQQTIELDRRIGGANRVSVCLRNAGDRRVAVYGGPELARRNSSVEVDGQEVATDMTLVFTRESRSALALVPDVFDRASAFRPAWVGPWTFWALAALLLLAVPGLLAAALRDAFGDRSELR